MRPSVVDIRETQGDSFEKTFRLVEGGEPIDLTGSTFAAAMRNREGDVTPLVVDVGPQPGEITLRYAETPPGYGHYRYDIERTDAGSQVATWITGRFDIDRDVANAAA